MHQDDASLFVYMCIFRTSLKKYHFTKYCKMKGIIDRKGVPITEVHNSLIFLLFGKENAMGDLIRIYLTPMNE